MRQHKLEFCRNILLYTSLVCTLLKKVLQLERFESFFGKWEETSLSHLRKGFLKCPYHTRFSWFYLLTQYRTTVTNTLKETKNLPDRLRLYN